MRKPITIEGRAVEIAAVVMEADNLCVRAGKCPKVYVYDKTCQRCIKAWLLNKARKELQGTKKV